MNDDELRARGPELTAAHSVKKMIRSVCEEHSAVAIEQAVNNAMPMQILFLAQEVYSLCSHTVLAGLTDTCTKSGGDFGASREDIAVAGLPSGRFRPHYVQRGVNPTRDEY
jgi:hypothetical protein